ncbi:signal peptidase II [Opitutus sp. ER46]|uniref:signal peptidase II n=1 Tax=Opitutus sp. ER46 TaxID=2161864 RepID=UPI000D307914|nr:signal peptidase II [Opitutus sp. ER46]PTX91243.1 signal peptidase II [Opitutus sp. ER46]
MSDTPPSPPPVTAATPPVAPARRPLPQRLLRYRQLWLLALTVYALDQLTKLWIVARLPFPTYGEASGAIPVIPGFFNLVHVGNTGAAWSMFSGRSVMLATLAVGTLAAIFLWRRALGLHQRAAQIAFGLLCGGIAGNLTDRLVYRHVIDFIDLHFGDYVYPTFNVADSGICIGVIVYLWISLRTPQPAAPTPPTP